MLLKELHSLIVESSNDVSKKVETLINAIAKKGVGALTDDELDSSNLDDNSSDISILRFLLKSRLNATDWTTSKVTDSGNAGFSFDFKVNNQNYGGAWFPESNDSYCYYADGMVKKKPGSK